MKTKRLIYFISRGKPHGLCILLKGIVPANCLLLVLMTLYSFVPAPLSESIELEKIPNLIIENNLRSGIDGDPLYTELKIQNPITGTVEDLGGPIPGVFVQVKDTNRTTMTDENGYYSISASPGEVLVFSYPGYETVEWIVGLDVVIDIEMYESFTYLDEAVINAGYYTVKDRERTGSISRVTADRIENLPVGNVLAAIEGSMPGIEIVQNSGIPGSGFEVLIRGKNSIAAGNEPLYIIDGVPYDTETLGFRNLSGGAPIPGGVINPLNTLNPSMIESVEVLKDADATAIYGSRGANGVILITTKKGNKGTISLNLKASSGWASLTGTTSLLNTQQYISMREKAFQNDGISQYPENAYDINGTWDRNKYTDWQELFIGNTATQNTVDLTLSGGSESIRYRIGGSILKETTVFPTDFKYNRLTVFSHINHQSKDEKLGFDFSFNYGVDTNFLPVNDLIQDAMSLPPNAPDLYDDEGNLNWENSTWDNPLAKLNGQYRNNSTNIIGNGVFSYQFVTNHKFKLNLGYALSELTERKIMPHTMYNPAYGYTSQQSRYQKNMGHRDSWILEPQMEGALSWNKIDIQYTLGGTFQERYTHHLVQSAEGFVNNIFIENFSAANQTFIDAENSTQYRYLAGFGRVNFNYNKKYFLNLTGRRDGSSRFGSGNKFANFGAVGLAWIFSKENFAKNLNWLTFGKIRTSWGTSGNDQIKDNQYQNTYSLSSVNYNGITLTPTRLFNPEYAWEINRKFDVALEGSLWSDRFQFEINYFLNRSGNQLVGIPLPGTTGFNSIQSNLKATVQNSGWELNLRSSIFNNKNFKWSSNFNLTIPNNKLIEFPNLENSTYASLYLVGKPISIKRLYYNTGINPETGVFEFQDYNDDGLINIEDRNYIVDMSPKYYGGFYNSLQYKSVSLEFLLQFTKKLGYNEYYNRSSTPGMMINQPIGYLDHWSGPGDTNSNYQIYTTGNNYDAYLAHINFLGSNRVISDASFIRLKSLSLAYLLNNIKGVDFCKISLNGYNLFTFTKFSGADPEGSASYLPPLKKISLGIEINF